MPGMRLPAATALAPEVKPSSKVARMVDSAQWVDHPRPQRPVSEASTPRRVVRPTFWNTLRPPVLDSTAISSRVSA